MHVSNIGNTSAMALGSVGYGAPEMDEDVALGMLYGFGYLYGAMGYTVDGALAEFGAAMDAEDADESFEDFGADDDEDVESIGDFGYDELGRRRRRGRPSGSGPRDKSKNYLSRAPKWLQNDYRKSNKRSKKALRAAGFNVPNKCPDGKRVLIGGRNYDRWLCHDPSGYDPGCSSPYMVWHRKSNRKSHDFPGRRHAGGRWHCRLLNCSGGRGIPCKKSKKWHQKVTGAISDGVKAAGKLGIKISLTPLKFMKDMAIKILMQAALPLARAVCKIPNNLIQAAAVANGMDPGITVARKETFCAAVRAKNWKDIRGLLPEMIKISIKVSATSAVPGLGFAINIMKKIPGLSKYVKFAGADAFGEADPIELLDSLSGYQMAMGVAQIPDEELAEGLGGAWTAKDTGTAVLLAGLLAVAGGALYAAHRAR